MHATICKPGLARQLPTKNNETRHSSAKLLVRPIRKKMASHTWYVVLSRQTQSLKRETTVNGSLQMVA